MKEKNKASTLFGKVFVDKQWYWVYILRCENNTYYTGYTNDLAKRYKSHVTGKGGCKYTRSFKPLGIAQSWRVSESKVLAMQLEREIKKLSRVEKENIISNPATLSKDPRVQAVEGGEIAEYIIPAKA